MRERKSLIRKRRIKRNWKARKRIKRRRLRSLRKRSSRLRRVPRLWNRRKRRRRLIWEWPRKRLRLKWASSASSRRNWPKPWKLFRRIVKRSSSSIKAWQKLKNFRSEPYSPANKMSQLALLRLSPQLSSDRVQQIWPQLRESSRSLSDKLAWEVYQPAKTLCLSRTTSRYSPRHTWSQTTKITTSSVIRALGRHTVRVLELHCVTQAIHRCAWCKSSRRIQACSSMLKTSATSKISKQTDGIKTRARLNTRAKICGRAFKSLECMPWLRAASAKTIRLSSSWPISMLRGLEWMSQISTTLAS